MPTESAEPAPEPAITGPGSTFEMPADPPPADDGGDPAVVQPAAGAKPSRQQRRAERADDFAARTSAAEDRARRAEEASQRTALELAELRGRVTATDAARLQQQGDPEAAALKAAQKKISAAVARMGQGDASAEEEWHAAQVEAQRIISRQIAREEGAEVEKRVVGKIPAQVDPRIAAFQAEFPYIVTNEHARAIARGYVAQVVALEKRDMSNPEVEHATHREAAAHAGKVLGLGGGGRQQPTEVDRGRVAGTSGRDSGAGAGPVRVHLNDQQMKMAEKLFRELPAAQAHQKWWKEIGSKIEAK